MYSFTWDFDGRTASGTLVGSANLQFNNAKSANFSWVVDGRSSTEEFVYLDASTAQTTKQFTGTYYDANDSGWGLTIHTQGNAQVAVIYYYDENGMPRWSLGSGVNNQASTIEMTSFTGFCPDCAYVFPTGQTIGSVDLGFEFGRKIQFSSDFTYPGSNSGWNINEVNLQALSTEFFDPSMQ